MKVATQRPGDAGYVAVFVHIPTGIVNVYGPKPTRAKAMTEVRRAKRQMEEDGREWNPAEFIAKVRPLLTDEMFGLKEERSE